MPRRCRSSLAIVVIALFLSGTAWVPLAAQSASPTPSPAIPSFTIHPKGQPDGTYLTLTMDPGEHQDVTLVLGNTSTTPQATRFFAADAFTGVNGGFSVRDAESPPTGVTTWLDFPSDTVNLDAGQGIERALGISVPADAAPGEYITAIVIQNAEPVGVSGSDVFSQTLRRAMAVLIVVPGPKRPAAEIGDTRIVEGPELTNLVTEIRNTGNERLNLAGQLVVRRANGKVAVTVPATISVIYAGDATTLEVAIGTQVPPGDYLVDLTLADAKRGVDLQQTNMPITVPDGNATPAAAPPVTVRDAAMTLVPGDGPLQLVTIDATIVNAGEPIAGAQLSLHVVRDGEPVEDFVLVPSLALPDGATPIQQRYVPAEGWQAGTYTLSLTLEIVDPTTGAATVLLDVPLAPDVVVP